MEISYKYNVCSFFQIPKMQSVLKTMCVLLFIYECLQIGQSGPCKFDERCQCNKKRICRLFVEKH